MNARLAAAAVTIVAMLSGAVVWAQHLSVRLSRAALNEIAEVEAEIDRIEAQTLERLAAPAQQRGATSRVDWQSDAL